MTPLAIFAQLAGDFAPPRANCCLPSTAQSLAGQLQDWNQLGRYHADNAKLLPEPGRVVYYGDSITDGWKLPESFPGKPYVNRGIGGQTTPQMLVRLFPDVITLKPAAMILLAGTNDIARNTGPTTHRPSQNHPASPGRHPETQRLASGVCRKIRRRLRRLPRRLRRRKGLVEGRLLR